MLCSLPYPQVNNRHASTRDTAHLARYYSSRQCYADCVCGQASPHLMGGSRRSGCVSGQVPPRPRGCGWGGSPPLIRPPPQRSQAPAAAPFALWVTSPGRSRRNVAWRDVGTTSVRAAADARCVGTCRLRAGRLQIVTSGSNPHCCPRSRLCCTQTRPHRECPQGMHIPELSTTGISPMLPEAHADNPPPLVHPFPYPHSAVRVASLGTCLLHSHSCIPPVQHHTPLYIIYSVPLLPCAALVFTLPPSLDAASYFESTLCSSKPQPLYSRYATCGRRNKAGSTTVSTGTDATKGGHTAEGPHPHPHLHPHRGPAT